MTQVQILPYVPRNSLFCDSGLRLVGVLRLMFPLKSSWSPGPGPPLITEAQSSVRVGNAYPEGAPNLRERVQDLVSRSRHPDVLRVSHRVRKAGSGPRRPCPDEGNPRDPTKLPKASSVPLPCPPWRLSGLANLCVSRRPAFLWGSTSRPGALTVLHWCLLKTHLRPQLLP